MFKKVLIALDPTEPDQKLLKKGYDLAKSLNAQLMLLSVLIPEGDNAFTISDFGALADSFNLNDWNLFQESYRAYKTKNANLLGQLKQQASDRGISTELAQKFGSPGRVICELAKAWQSDLIMVGSHQRTGLSELILGSISNYVMHHAPCSVLVVHA